MAEARCRLLIVDGYNVLRSGSRYARIALPDYTDDTFNQARDRLINDVVDFAGQERAAVIVFDAADNAYAATESDTAVGGVRVMFTRRGQSADRLIEKLAYDAKERGVETLVVSSDAGIQDAVFGGGVDRMSAEGFCQEMELHAREVREEEAPKIARKSTVEERISPDMAARLRTLRDSL